MPPTKPMAPVSLTIAAGDGGSGSGVTEMLIANDSLFSGAIWRSYETEVDFWSLQAGAADYVDGTVYAKFRDASGRESAAYIEDAIRLDNVAPTGPAVSIEGGAAYVDSATVDLTLTASGADFRQVSLDPGDGMEL